MGGKLSVQLRFWNRLEIEARSLGRRLGDGAGRQSKLLLFSTLPVLDIVFRDTKSDRRELAHKMTLTRLGADRSPFHTENLDFTTLSARYGIVNSVQWFQLEYIMMLMAARTCLGQACELVEYGPQDRLPC